MWYQAIMILLLFIGLLFVIVEIVRINGEYYKQEPRIIYRYIPRTFDEEQEDPVSVSDVFETMFSQPSPWVGSLRNYDRRKQEKINQYFITQL